MLALSRPCGVSSSRSRAALPRRALRCAAMSSSAAGSASAQPRVPKVIVVGAGRVGAALERMGDGEDVARAPSLRRHAQLPRSRRFRPRPRADAARRRRR